MKKSSIFIKKLLATGFYTGYAPVMSGTIGTLVGVLIYIMLVQYPIILYPLIIFLFVYGIKLSDWAENYFKKKDSEKIVIDEIVGFLITMANIKIIYNLNSLKFYIVIITGFVIVRFFDILKPLYINKIQEIKGGLGVMLDDIVAGIYSNLILIIITYYIILKI